MLAVPALASSETGIVVEICVPETVPTANFVVVVPAIQFTWETCVGSELEERKLVPVKVIDGAMAGPATMAFGLIEVRVGCRLGGGLIIKAIGLESPF